MRHVTEQTVLFHLLGVVVAHSQTRPLVTLLVTLLHLLLPRHQLGHVYAGRMRYLGTLRDRISERLELADVLLDTFLVGHARHRKVAAHGGTLVSAARDHQVRLVPLHLLGCHQTILCRLFKSSSHKLVLGGKRNRVRHRNSCRRAIIGVHNGMGHRKMRCCTSCLFVCGHRLVIYPSVETKTQLDNGRHSSIISTLLQPTFIGVWHEQSLERENSLASLAREQ